MQTHKAWLDSRDAACKEHIAFFMLTFLFLENLNNIFNAIISIDLLLWLQYIEMLDALA